jgi:hypothetical protein
VEKKCFEDPCVGCPVRVLIPSEREEAAFAVEKMLTEHSAVQIEGCTPAKLEEIAIATCIGEVDKSRDYPITIDVVASAVRKVIEQKCPSRQ